MATTSSTSFLVIAALLTELLKRQRCEVATRAPAVPAFTISYMRSGAATDGGSSERVVSRLDLHALVAHAVENPNAESIIRCAIAAQHVADQRIYRVSIA